MKKGFTLIELLVVVLIIGILSSVALPQYTKAVEKSRNTEALIALKNLSNAQELCVLEKGTASSEFCYKQDANGNNLFNAADVTIGGTPRTCSGCGPETKNWRFQQSSSGFIEAYKTNNKFYLTTTAHPSNSARPAYKKILCRIDGTSGTADDCKAAGFTVVVLAGQAWTLP